MSEILDIPGNFLRGKSGKIDNKMNMNSYFTLAALLQGVVHTICNNSATKTKKTKIY